MVLYLSLPNNETEIGTFTSGASYDQCQMSDAIHIDKQFPPHWPHPLFDFQTTLVVTV